MKSKYTSGKSVGKNQTVPIGVDDPRLKPGKIGQTKARQGAEIDIVGLDGKALIGGGRNVNNPAGRTPPAPLPPDFGSITIPRGGNKPPKTYPGGSGPVIVVPTDPTNVSVAWVGNDLVISFDWDYANDVNDSVSQFIVELTSGGVTKRSQSNIFIPNTTQTRQTVTVTKSIITSMFNVFRTSFSAVCVLTADPLNNISNTICAATVPDYVLDLPVPVITVSAISGGYSVGYTIPTQDVYDAIDVEEHISEDTPTSNAVYTRTYFGSISPANIISSNTSKRWVRARFSSDAGIYTAYSSPIAVTPTSPVGADTEGPSNVTSVTTTGGLDSTGTIGFNGFANISWPSVTGGGIRGYRIRFRPVTDPVSSYSYADSPGTGTSYRLAGLGAGLVYEIAVATYDEYNNTSSNYFDGANVTVGGTPYIASTVDVTGFFQAKANASDEDSTAFKFGYGVDTGKRGLVFNTNNYWYIDSDQSASLKVGGSTTNYIQWNGTSFIIDGDLRAKKGSFSGNINMADGASVYSGTIGGNTVTATGDSYGSLTSSGYILNSSGITFSNGLSGSALRQTTIVGETGLLTTNAANIGGWSVDSSSISRSGTANISLNSTAGNISVSAQNIAGYTSGINGPIVSTGSTPVDNINGTPVGAENVFWAGTGGATGTSNAFRVTLAGNLYASNAKITGTVASVGALGTMTMDGEHGYISLQTGGSGAPTAYLVPRNNNIYLTSPSATPPWTSGKDISSSGPVNGPYISAGSSYRDYWGNTTVGAGLFTGTWDYFTTGASTPFITATTTGLQLSAGPDIGLLLDAATASTGDKLTPAIPTGQKAMLFYTAKRTTLGSKGQPIYSPDTEYGAWASFTNRVIKLTADEFLFINVEGSDTPASRRIIMKATDDIAYQMNSEGIKIQIDSDTHQTFRNDNITIQAVGNTWQRFNSSGIRTQISDSVYQEFNSSGIKINAAAETFVSVGTNSTVTLQGSSQVVIGSGVGQGGAFPIGGVSAYEGPSKITLDPTYGVVITGIQVQRDLDMTDAGSGGNYRSTPPLGRYPRSRMLIEDPVTGQVMLGMGVYYRGSGITSTPTSDTGYAGDLLVDF